MITKYDNIKIQEEKSLNTISFECKEAHVNLYYMQNIAPKVLLISKENKIEKIIITGETMNTSVSCTSVSCIKITKEEKYNYIRVHFVYKHKISQHNKKGKNTVTYKHILFKSMKHQSHKNGKFKS